MRLLCGFASLAVGFSVAHLWPNLCPAHCAFQLFHGGLCFGLRLSRNASAWFPIAQKRVTHVGAGIVRFLYKDKKLRRKVYVECSPEEFIERWSHHIPDRYRHAVRSFGSFAPRVIPQTTDAVFAILGQKRRTRPKPRRYDC